MQRLVDADFGLKAIGDFVGHRSAASTEIYAKVAVESLRQVALGDGEEVLAMTVRTLSSPWRFLAHKRALGRKYLSEEHELRLLVRFADEHGSSGLTNSPGLAGRRSWLRGPGPARAASTISLGRRRLLPGLGGQPGAAAGSPLRTTGAAE